MKSSMVEWSLHVDSSRSRGPGRHAAQQPSRNLGSRTNPKFYSRGDIDIWHAEARHAVNISRAGDMFIATFELSLADLDKEGAWLIALEVKEGAPCTRCRWKNVAAFDRMLPGDLSGLFLDT